MWDFLPVAMNVIGAVFGKTGSDQAGQAARIAGDRQQAADDFQAAQLTQNAGQALAAGQRIQLNIKREGDLAQSRTLALAAASGGGTGGSVIDVLSRMSGETALRMGTALYQSEDQARQMRMAAAAKTFEGQAAEESGIAKQDAYQTAGFGSLFKGAGSLFTNYAAGGFKGSTSPIGAGGINWDLI